MLSIHPSSSVHQLKCGCISIHFVFTFSYSWDRQFLCSSGLIIYGRDGGLVCARTRPSLFIWMLLPTCHPQSHLCSRGQGSPDAIWPFFFSWLSLPTQSIQFLSPLSLLAVSSKSQEFGWIFTVFWSSRPHMFLVSQNFRSLTHLT